MPTAIQFLVFIDLVLIGQLHQVLVGGASFSLLEKKEEAASKARAASPIKIKR